MAAEVSENWLSRFEQERFGVATRFSVIWMPRHADKAVESGAKGVKIRTDELAPA
jgi:hypothetical protein